MSENKSDSIERQLLAARHEKGVELSDVHRATGVSASVLAGLESGAFDVVEPVFTRLALSAYVDYLGLDKQDILGQYDERCAAVSQPVQADASAPGAQRAPRAETALDLDALRVVAIAAGALVALLLVIALVDDDADRDMVAAAQTVPAVPSARAPAPAAVPSQPVAVPAGQPSQAESDTERALAEQGLGDASVSVAQGEDRAEVESDPIAPVMGEEFAGEAAPVAEGEAVVEVAVLPTVAEGRDENAGDRVERAGLADGQLLVYGDELVLEIEAIDSTWVQVKWDESGLFDAIVPPGSVHRWQARDAFIVHSGRAHGLRYTFQGELLGKGALGEATKVLRFRADASGVILLDRNFQPLSSNVQP